MNVWGAQGFLWFSILAASGNQTTESTARNESSEPYSTGCI